MMRALSTRDGGGIGHAGEMETSIQLYLQAERMDLAAVTPEQCLDIRARAVVQSRGVYLPPHPPEESPHGVYGMSHAGTRDKGERIVETAARELAAFVRTFHR